VRHHVEAGALLEAGQLERALERASRAYSLATEAFSHPTLMAMLYFPDEHKMAVYFPLMVPTLLPLLINAAKEFKRWRRPQDYAEGREGVA
jgi:phosphatidylinositol glycan class S